MLRVIHDRAYVFSQYRCWRIPLNTAAAFWNGKSFDASGESDMNRPTQSSERRLHRAVLMGYCATNSRSAGTLVAGIAIPMLASLANWRNNSQYSFRSISYDPSNVILPWPVRDVIICGNSLWSFRLLTMGGLTLPSLVVFSLPKWSRIFANASCL